MLYTVSGENLNLMVAFRYTMGDKPSYKDHIDGDGRIVLCPIGIVHSPLKRDSEEVPFQSFTSDIEGSIEIFEEYEAGLDGIERFSHISVIYYMHISKKTKLRTVPLMEEGERGIFGTRSPSRPNHIGISTVRLKGRRGREVDVLGLDMLDGTPVIDIKPYVPKVDLVKGVDNDWLMRKLERVEKLGTRKLDEIF